jgi:hypothetical protein
MFKMKRQRRNHENHVQVDHEGVLASEGVISHFDPYLPEALTDAVLYAALVLDGHRLTQLSYVPIIAPLHDQTGHIHAVVEGWPESWKDGESTSIEPQVVYVFGDGRLVHYDCALNWALGREDATPEELLEALELIEH